MPASGRRLARVKARMRRGTEGQPLKRANLRTICHERQLNGQTTIRLFKCFECSPTPPTIPG